MSFARFKTAQLQLPCVLKKTLSLSKGEKARNNIKHNYSLGAKGINTDLSFSEVQVQD